MRETILTHFVALLRRTPLPSASQLSICDFYELLDRLSEWRLAPIHSRTILRGTHNTTILKEFRSSTIYSLSQLNRHCPKGRPTPTCSITLPARIICIQLQLSLLPIFKVWHGSWQRCSKWLRISIFDGQDGCTKAAPISFISAPFDATSLWRPGSKRWLQIVVHWRRRGTLQGKCTAGTLCVQAASDRRSTRRLLSKPRQSFHSRPGEVPIIAWVEPFKVEEVSHMCSAHGASSRLWRQGWTHCCRSDAAFEVVGWTGKSCW